MLGLNQLTDAEQANINKIKTMSEQVQTLIDELRKNDSINQKNLDTAERLLDRGLTGLVKSVTTKTVLLSQ